MTPKSTAEKLARHTAMKCTGSIINDTQAILATIPIVEYEECVEAARKSGCDCQISSLDERGETLYGHGRLIKECDFCKALANLAAKLKEKGQP